MSRRWNVLDRIIKENGFEFAVELGCKEGKTTSFLLANNPTLRMVAVDLFSPIDRPKSAGSEDYKDWDFNAIKAEFEDRTKDVADRLQLLHMSTTDAAGIVLDGQVDLVFIDAGHDYASVCEDIDHWLPKVRKGGIVSGHDFSQKFPGVQRAVAEKFSLNDVHLEQDSVWWVRV